MMASGCCLRYALAMSSAKLVLKCFDGPASTVRPDDRPPSIRPESAAFTIGTFVGHWSCSEKNLDVARTEVSLIREFFLSLSITDGMYLLPLLRPLIDYYNPF